jgi:hypothetical protein
VGEARKVVLVKKGSPADVESVVLDEQAEFKALWLWRWASEEGKKVSRDEAAEMVACGSMPADLQALWNRRSALQKASLALCEAAAAGDVDAARVVLASHPGLFADTGGMAADCVTGVAPLHLAAEHGHVAMVELLLESAVAVDGRDGAGKTAREAAKRADQSDVEGVLARAGAADPDRGAWPGESPLPEDLAEPAVESAVEAGMAVDEDKKKEEAQEEVSEPAGASVGPASLQEEAETSIAAAPAGTTSAHEKAEEEQEKKDLVEPAVPLPTFKKEEDEDEEIVADAMPAEPDSAVPDSPPPGKTPTDFFRGGKWARGGHLQDLLGGPKNGQASWADGWVAWARARPVLLGATAVAAATVMLIYRSRGSARGKGM